MNIFFKPTLVAALAMAVGIGPAQAQTTWSTLTGAAPIIIAHRGASGLLPEHTLAAYTKAIEQGADYIEPDVVLTKDGVMIARHEPILDGTTDVASKFGADRQSTRVLDGVSTKAYFASDFTLAEIKTLRTIQPRASRDQSFNGLYEIPTLQEVVNLAKAQSVQTGRSIGIYPEIKHSAFHASIFGAKVIEDKLVSALHAAYGNSAAAPVFIQSFEVSNLKYLNGRTDIRLVQLVDADDVKPDGSLSLVPPYAQPYDFVLDGDPRTFADLLTKAGLAEIATYADGIGPWKPYLLKTVDDGVDRDGDGVITAADRRVDGSTGVIEAAHEAGLLVHAYTFRDDAGKYGFTDPAQEIAAYLKLGVDGVFTDYTATGVAARSAVPEPGTTLLCLAGLAVVGCGYRKRKCGEVDRTMLDPSTRHAGLF